VCLQSVSSYPALFDYGGLNNMQLDFWNTSQLMFQSPSSVWVESTGTVPLNQWHHVAFTYDRSSGNASLFIDGTNVSVSVNNLGSISMSASGTVYLGGRGAGNGANLTGLLDEMRISDLARSTNWIWAEYMTAASNSVFSSYGTVAGAGAIATTVHGIPLSWLASYGITNTADSVETNNPDGDSLNNLQEYIAGTDPTNPNSCFSVVITNVAGQIVVRIPSIQATGSNYSGRTRYYDIEQCTNLLSGATWQPAPGYSNVLANSGIIACTNATPAPISFYRAKVWLQ
jgi:hypothetical protein